MINLVDINKEDCKEECSKGCSCKIIIGNSKKKDRTQFQEIMNHLGNIFWIFFILALMFSHNVYIIWATLIAAIVFEEFD